MKEGGDNRVEKVGNQHLLMKGEIQSSPQTPAGSHECIMANGNIFILRKENQHLFQNINEYGRVLKMPAQNSWSRGAPTSM
jgi:hypothetical protein